MLLNDYQQEALSLKIILVLPIDFRGKFWQDRALSISKSAYYETMGKGISYSVEQTLESCAHG